MVFLEITRIGKEYFRDPSARSPREIIMHEKGVFCVVLRSGIIKPGDMIQVIG